MKKKRINAMSHVWNLRQQVLIFRNFLMIGTDVVELTPEEKSRWTGLTKIKSMSWRAVD